jgi:hypothetical protein
MLMIAFIVQISTLNLAKGVSIQIVNECTINISSTALMPFYDFLTFGVVEIPAAPSTTLEYADTTGVSTSVCRDQGMSAVTDEKDICTMSAGVQKGPCKVRLPDLTLKSFSRIFHRFLRAYNRRHFPFNCLKIFYKK